jgi:hypothetical protein
MPYMVRIVNTNGSNVKSEAVGVCVKSKQGTLLYACPISWKKKNFASFLSSLTFFIVKECKLKTYIHTYIHTHAELIF